MDSMTLIADVDPGLIYYYAVIRDAEGLRVSNCDHRHRTREAAERCANLWLRPQFLAQFKADTSRSAR